MSSRVQVVLSDAEREAFRQQAAAEKLTLSAWLREAARARLEEHRRRPLQTVEDVRTFFSSLPEEEGREPEWSAHLRVMDESRGRGRATT